MFEVYDVGGVRFESKREHVLAVQRGIDHL